MKKIFCFTGASHTGKSTFGKILKEEFGFDFREVSARPFLKDNISYDKQVDNEIQSKIMYNNVESFWKSLFEAQECKENICLSRCPIDVLAYSFALNKGLEFELLLNNTIDLIKDKAIFIYTPADFPMTEKEDKKRGMNEKVRQETDFNIKRILMHHKISALCLMGNKEEKERQLKAFINKKFKEHDIPNL